MNEPQRRPTPHRTFEAEPPAARPKPGALRCLVSVAVGVLALAALAPVQGQPDTGRGAAAAESQPAPAQLGLFAIEITVGPAWDSAKPPNAQPYFAEHSANLRRLRESGQLVMGARCSDKGLIVVRAGSAEEVHAMMAQDPSIEAGTFRYAVHPFAVFYPGLLEARPRD